MKVKCKVVNVFNDLQNKNKQRKVGEEFECTLERAEFLQKNNVVEIIEVAEKPTKETSEQASEQVEKPTEEIPEATEEPLPKKRGRKKQYKYIANQYA